MKCLFSAAVLWGAIAGSAWAAGLAEDDRVGKVADVQGIVTLKPAAHERWTAVCGPSPVWPGDWVRTDLRGANAVEIRLTGGASVVLGPGTLVELVGGEELNLVEGELEVAPGEKPVKVRQKTGQPLSVKKKQVLRLAGGKLQELAKEPLWLTGFRGAAVNESLGSLVAKVDGRDVPLTVGYHKVTVDIRDQIARTVVEESFVNHTKFQLEGVFYFPLPADASISGFGMWIGDKLVEADVVEKQRAREIYETILREKRDPGLLEWSGGNIFKARVFPIFANSEKRIKITYTQVLPMRGSSYRYSYALQSELLKQNPLRELSLDVTVQSTLPLKSVSSPTHDGRIRQTANSSRYEFTAQEYTPTRDFELVIDADQRNREVVLVPHERGDDGYFILMIAPPGAQGDWQRPLVADGDPLDLVILADTSGSMDAAARKTQDAFLATLLSSLGPKDSFNLATCDVTCNWMGAEKLSGTQENVAKARAFVAARRALGWTDLDKAFAAAVERTTDKTQVIYIGDGITTTGDADPVAFAARLARLYGKRGTFHAVAPGSSYESVVLKAVASLGGGSLRRIEAGNGDNGPASAALELLSEITQPVLRDLKIEFQGLQTARVYPERLPNIPAGYQQIILGRYLPQGRSAAGEVIVSGTLAGKPVQYRTQVSLEEAEKGNSFIPRLWARLHLDVLLDQGTSQAIQDEIIALSEEYNLMTPYTSLLVLESDADRERFKVQKRFRMRDGEKFFAEGRDTANFALVQQQMKAAGAWRIGLQKRILRDLASLGRNPRLFEARSQYNWNGPMGGGTGGMSGGGGGAWGASTESWYEDFTMFGRPSPHPSRSLVTAGLTDEFSTDFASLGDWLSDERLSVDKSGEGFGDTAPAEMAAEDAAVAASGPMGEPELSLRGAMPLNRYSGLGVNFGNSDGGDMYFDGTDYDSDGRFESRSGRRGTWALGLQASKPMMFRADLAKARGFQLQAARGRYKREAQYQSDPVFRLFPSLPAPPTAPEAIDPDVAWPAEARALVESLVRRDKLAELKGGVEVRSVSESYDIRRKQLSSRSEQLALVSPETWLTRGASDNAQTMIQWCTAKTRGLLATGFQLGRERNAAKGDLTAYDLSLSDHSLASLEREYQTYTPTVEKQGEDRALLKLVHPDNPKSAIHFLIDTRRHVVVRLEQLTGKKVTWVTTYSDFVEVGGCWWATKIETIDDQERRSALVTLKVQALAPAQFEARHAEELASRKDFLVLADPLPTVPAAKQAVAGGKASVADQLVMTSYYAARQQWPRVNEQLEKLEKLVADKPGWHWISDSVLQASRRHEESKDRIMADAARLAKQPANQTTRENEMYMASYLVGQAAGILQALEMLKLFDTLEPIYTRAAKHVDGPKQWLQHRVGYLSQTDPEAALAAQRKLAEQHADDYGLQTQYAQALAAIGEFDAAQAWLERALKSEFVWLTHERSAIRSTATQLLEQQERFEDLEKYLDSWLAEKPDDLTPYDQYLSVLIRTDQLDKAEQLMKRWLTKARQAKTLKGINLARAQAAIRHALGQGHGLSTNRLLEKWIEPLAKIVPALARSTTHRYLADQIMSHHQFQSTDEARRLRKQFATALVKKLDKWPVDRVVTYVNWLNAHRGELDDATWRKIGQGLETRWVAETKPARRHQLGQTLITVLSGENKPEAVLAFLRRQLKEGPQKYRSYYATQLFQNVMGQGWSQAYEDEALALFDKLSEEKEPDVRLAAQLTALFQLVDRMVQARTAAANAELEHVENLSRSELAAKKLENLRVAQRGVADHLRAEQDKHGDRLRPWLVVERLYLAARIGDKLDDVAAECWELAGAKPKADVAGLEWLVRDRVLTTLGWLATRPNAKPEIVERLLAYFDQGIALEPEDASWKVRKYQLLVALDKPEQIEKNLRAWIRPEVADNSWRVSLGYLLAELKRLDEAIREFEAIEKADELLPAEYRALAAWYHVQGNRERNERALIGALMAEGEYPLARRLEQGFRPWQVARENMPTALDENLLRVIAALLKKTETPQNYFSYLQSLYENSRDFRLLESLSDAMVGHTSLKAYPLLQCLDHVLNTVQDEATVDSMMEYLPKVRERAKTAVDRRALDFLEMLVERRAAEIKNQPGPHTKAALAAMQRAAKGEWVAGERRMMADILNSLGKMKEKPLADEQLRQLAELYNQEPKGTADRLHIADRRARTLFAYERWEDSLQLLEIALAEYRTAQGGKLPQAANETLGTFIGYLENRQHFARGEKYLHAELQHPINQRQKQWLTVRLYDLWNATLSSGGEISLGRGEVLYKAAEKRLIADVEAPSVEDHRQNVIHRLLTIYRTAHDKKIGSPATDLAAFARERLPAVLKYHTTYLSNIVGAVADTMHHVIGPKPALAFLIERIEKEPAWLQYGNRDGWSQHVYRLGSWRKQIGDVGILTGSLLKIVTTELRRDLTTRQQRNREMYEQNHQFYWAEQVGAFAKVADEVIKEKPDSVETLKYVAQYLFHAIGRRERAIAVLAGALERKILDDDGQSHLVYYLQETGRFAESVPILLGLVEKHPDAIGYRVQLMRAWYKTGRNDKLLAELEETDKRFHENKQWNESTLAQLASSTLDNKLFKQSVAYYKELIPLHERTQPNRGIGNGTLSVYYRQLASAHSGLGQTAEAVEAAGAAIVSWGAHHHNRQEAVEHLRYVLREAKDLDAYVKTLDAQVAESGLENAIVRKALGQVYLEKQAFDKAVVQLKLAISVQPNDADTHKALLAAYDQQQNRQGAIDALLAWTELARRDINLYRDLGQRYKALENPHEAERAFTTIVEMQPTESESHTMLAEIRQEQNRWPDAVVHWQQVARIRALEPTGNLRLAAAQIHLAQWDAAQETLQKVRSKDWPKRFGEVQTEARKLEQQIDAGRKAGK